MMSVWKSKSQQDLRHVFADPKDVQEAADIVVNLLRESRERVSFHDIVVKKMGVSLPGVGEDPAIPASMASEFSRMSEMVRHGRLDIKECVEESDPGLRLVVVDASGRSSLKSGACPPFGYCLRASIVGDADDRAQAKMAVGALKSIVAGRVKAGLIPSDDVGVVDALLAGTMRALEGHHE